LNFWGIFTLNFKCQPEDEMCPSQFYTTFTLAEFSVFRHKLENVAKVPDDILTSRGLTHLARVLTKVVGVGLSKVLKGEC
jgi:hypothetical protein